jgi:hypothetical protein
VRGGSAGAPCWPKALPDMGPVPSCPPCRELSKEPHLASTPRDEELVQLLLQRWRDPESGLDSAVTSTYEVLLSFPSQEQPNLVEVGKVLPNQGKPGGGGGPAGSSPGSASLLSELRWEHPLLLPTG